jgi:tetratricopeptide (TPR) repeat protein
MFDIQKKNDSLYQSKSLWVIINLFAMNLSFSFLAQQQEKVFSIKQKFKRNFRSLSQGDLAQEKHEIHYKSCPSLVFEYFKNRNSNEDEASSSDSKPFVILSGSASGLASIGLQNLVKRYTNISLPDEDQTAWHIIEPHFSQGPPRIRLEGVFEIIQQYIDPNLSLLDVLMTDTPAIDRSHEILAMLTHTSTVITTNFDHLIEDAGRLHQGNDPNIVPFDVFCTEEHFKKAFDSINSGTSTNLIGLWKIHGTVAIWKNKQRVLVRADEDGGPVATLKRLSITRESIERRCFLHHLLETRPFIIINYSATDDFDVTRWLKTVKAPLKVLWIQQIDSSLEPVSWNGIDIIKGIPSNITSFDRGLITMAYAWHDHGVADHLTVVTVADPVGFLLQITGLNILPQNDHAHLTNSNDDYLLSSPTRWQSYIVSGAMLTHLSYFSEAKRYFDHAASISIVGTREYCIAKLAAAEASIETGDRNGRIEAMNDALDTAETAPPSLSSWSDKKAQFISAVVKRFVEKDGQAIAITELQQLLNDCGKPEDVPQGRERNVALDAANLLAQLRRYLPSSPDPSDLAKQWIELIPKTGLLHTKGMNLHESALNKYQVATNIEELDDAIDVMKEAIEIREELGHMRGLVASLNVLGSMQMRRSDWNLPFDITYIKRVAEQFRRSIKYSDKHASVFERFQARIHLTVCLLRYSSIVNTIEELPELLNYFQTRTTDDLRTQIESEFCLAMSIFMDSSLSVEEMCNKGEELFDKLANAYTSNKDVRLIRILAAARFNSELCRDWKKGQAHIPNPELTRDITTRKTGTTINAYWLMRISNAETQIPMDNYQRLQLLLDPISP